MKKIFLFLFVCSIISLSHAQEFEGIEKGDKEISVYGFLTTTIGTDFNMSMGNFFLSYGSYMSDKLLVGVAPGVSISTIPDGLGGNEISADISGQFFANYNFSTDKPVFPFARASYYQQSFDIPDGASFTDLGSIQVGLGLKSFLSANIAWETTLTYGFSLAENAEGGILMLMTGITVIL